jgi:hypothetical protein
LIHYGRSRLGFKKGRIFYFAKRITCRDRLLRILEIKPKQLIVGSDVILAGEEIIDLLES